MLDRWYDEQYMNLFTPPCVYWAYKGQDVLLLYGTRHSYEMSKQELEIIKIINKFLPEILFAEGLPNNPTKFLENNSTKGLKDIVMQYGEITMGAVVQIKRQGKVISAEPSLKDEYSYLCVKYRWDEVIVYFTLRLLLQGYTRNNNEIYQYINKIFEYVIASLGMTLSRESWESVIDFIIGKSIYEISQEECEKLVDPIKRQGNGNSIFNAIAKESSMFRDKQLHASVISLSKKNRKKMILYGYNHIPVLIKMLEKSGFLIMEDKNVRI